VRALRLTNSSISPKTRFNLELLTYSNNSTAVETPTTAFPKKDSDTHCNGKLHRQDGYCQRPAGWGTPHAGSGRCKLHGGCCTGRGSGQLRYSDFLPTTLIEKYEEFASETDVDMKSLNAEIAMIRAKIANLSNTTTGFNIATNDSKILQFTELLRRLVETKQKVEEGIKSKVSIEVAIKVVDNFISIVEKRVQDAETKRLIADDMRRLDLTKLHLN